MKSFFASLTRRKRISDGDDESKSELARVLNLFDLTALGVGSTLGLGVYVLAGSVAFEQAGPAVILSFLVAAIASAFAGLCYAEFAARVPKAGSAYVYSYVSVGEFVAFIIGWNLILEYVIGTASVARGLSGYIDALFDNKMAETLRNLFPIRINFLADHPDFFSLVMVVLLAILLAVGVKESSYMNNIFTTVNVCVIIIVVVAGAIKSDPANWQIKKESIPANVNGGNGGFMPFGIAGIMAGAAKCFYGFVGFDCVATTGEEAQNPQRNIPLSIVFSLIIIFIAYFGVSTVLTLMWPYYLQNPDAPFPHVFQEIGWIEIKWIVTVGAVFALCTALLGAMFPLPRILYAMSTDGILFKRMSRVNERTRTPIFATILSGVFAGIMAMMFNLHQLIDMMSIGTLLAYTIVAICILILRYQDDHVLGQEMCVTIPKICTQLFNLNFIKHPNSLSSYITKVAISVFSVITLIFCGLVDYVEFTWDRPFSAIVLLVVCSTLVLIVFIIGRQPTENVELSFKVPCVPFIPCLSIIINFYLMFQLDYQTWIRFIFWLIIGCIIYFSYGIHNSVEGKRIKAEKQKKVIAESHEKYIKSVSEDCFTYL